MLHRAAQPVGTEVSLTSGARQCYTLDILPRIAVRVILSLLYDIAERMPLDSSVTAANLFFQLAKDYSGDVTLHMGYNTISLNASKDDVTRFLSDLLYAQFGSLVCPTVHEPSFPAAAPPILDWGRMQTLLWKHALQDNEHLVDKEAEAISARYPSMLYGNEEGLKMRLREKMKCNVLPFEDADKEISWLIGTIGNDLLPLGVGSLPLRECIDKICLLSPGTKLYAKALSSQGENVWYIVKYVSHRNKEPRVRVLFVETLEGSRADILLPSLKTDFVFSTAIRFP